MGYRILVTGGAGYLGSVLVPELLAAGHEVTVVDNFMYSQNSLAHVCAQRHFRVVRGDIRIDSVMMPLIREADHSARRLRRRAAWLARPGRRPQRQSRRHSRDDEARGARAVRAHAHHEQRVRQRRQE
jgi:hypothetical protein